MRADLVMARETGGRQVALRALTELLLQKQGHLQCLQWQAVEVRMCHKSTFFFNKLACHKLLPLKEQGRK